ncbi:MAG: FG-GAP-like repeat-containing protein [Ignavibacteria bacterium]|nr:FG-GAP-like repeat-containing protein [Ignavibacteria bacterium]
MKDLFSVTVATLFTAISMITSQGQTYSTDGFSYMLTETQTENSTIGSMLFGSRESSLYTGNIFFTKQDTMEGDGIQQYGLLGSSAMDEFGTSVSDAGDVNADGYEDIIVGAPLSDAAFTDGGCAYIHYGGPVVNFDADVVMPGHLASQHFGLCVSSAGDVNNDGYDDVIIGAPNDPAAKTYIYFGSANMDNIPDVILAGTLGFGTSVSSAGDINDDGFSDVISSNPGLDLVRVYFGGSSMDNSPDLVINHTYSLFGISVSSAGDINSDGYSDFVIGAMLASSGSFTNNGAAFVYFGGPALDNIADVILTGAVSFDKMGNAVDCAGDVNGDGFSDIVIGAYSHGNYRGKAYVYYGGSLMDVNPDVTFIGEQNGDWLGQSVAGSGDINGDGYDDVLIGAFHNSENAQSAGKAYLYYGGSNMNNIADNQFAGTTINSEFGCSLSSAGDFNNDGYKDFLIGEYKNSEAGTNAGKAHLYTNTSNLIQISMLNFAGSISNGQFGNSLASAGDLNADGYDDFVAGMSNAVSGQPARIFFGGRLMDNSADVSLYGSPYVSFRVASAGDVNNDGFDDIITADPFNSTNGTDAGAAFVFLGSQNMSGVPFLTIYGNSAGDKFGYSISTAGDVNNDGYDDVIVGAPLSDDNGFNAGTAYVFYGGANMNNVPDVIMFGEFGNQLGFSVSGGGKINTDQYDDVLAGSPFYSPIEVGRVHLYYGGSPMNGSPDLVFNNPAPLTQYERFGWSVESSGDVNGDSYSDIVIGALGHSMQVGEAYIYHGGSSLDNSPDVTLSGENFSYQFGGSIASSGDINNDGFDDVIIGEASFNYYSDNFRGRISLFYGGSSMDNVADRIIYGENQNDRFGYSVSGAGDVDGDGVAEFLAGAPLNSNGFGGFQAGTIYLFKGSETASDISDIVFNGSASEQFGYSVASARDFNADGFEDVIIGTPKSNANGTESGTASVYFGGVVWNKSPDITISGESAFDHFGTSVSYAGDVNQDLYDDIIVGAPENDAAGTDAGRAYIYFGGPSADGVADLILNGESSGDRFGFSVSTSGNVNGDLSADVIVGAPFSNAGGNQAGRSYIYYGGASMNSVADVVLTFNVPGAWFGICCSSAGDVNGDQYYDVIVGAGCQAGVANGYASIYYGGLTMNNVSDVDMFGLYLDDHFGYSVSYAGDVNGDQYSDVIVGAYGYDLPGTDAGAAFIYYGGANMNGSSDVYIEGSEDNDYFGVSVSYAGRINSDNIADVVIGACYNDAGGTNAGRSYVYYGGTSMDNKKDLVMTGNVPHSASGFAVSYAGDLNSDGRSDLIIGGLNSGRVQAYLSSEPVEQLILTLKLAQEGFYNTGTQKLNMSDTVVVSLRNSYFPFNQVDEAKAVINKVTMEGRFVFNSAPAGSYYLKVKHRNCVETWSANPVSMAKNRNVNYDFTFAAFQAYGFNQKIINNTPLVFGIYSGDVNNDGTVDATDGSIIDNDVINFVTGYTVTDVTGDYFVDAADYLMADNNAYNFVTKITP